MTEALRLIPSGKYEAILNDIRAPTRSRQGRFYISLVFELDTVGYPIMSHQYCSLTLGYMVYKARKTFIGRKYELKIKNIVLEWGEFNEIMVNGEIS